MLSINHTHTHTHSKSHQHYTSPALLEKFPNRQPKDSSKSVESITWPKKRNCAAFQLNEVDYLLAPGNTSNMIDQASDAYGKERACNPRSPSASAQTRRETKSGREVIKVYGELKRPSSLAGWVVVRRRRMLKVLYKGLAANIIYPVYQRWILNTLNINCFIKFSIHPI